jgi:DNA modification methylase
MPRRAIIPSTTQEHLIISSRKIAPSAMNEKFEILNPKRAWNAPTGREGWFPYYAGFSADFATTLIRSASLPSDAWVLDPWNGSGTTTSAAASLARSSMGFDLNPVMVIVAKARVLCAREKGSLLPLLSDILRKAKKLDQKVAADDALLLWFVPSTAKALRNIERVVQQLLLDPDSYQTIAALDNLDALSDLCAFYYTALFRTARQLSSGLNCSNPTWRKRPESKGNRARPSGLAIFETFRIVTRQMVQSIEESDIVDSSTSECEIAVGDSQSIPNESQSVDMVITSPPYCTRIDYAVSTAVELAVLGFRHNDHFDKLRRQLIGTTTVAKEPPAIRFEWGASCARFLDALFKHSSRASATYYFKNHLQYFDAIHRSMREINRVLKRAGSCVLVLQDSYYKELHNDLPKIVIEMAEGIGMDLVKQKRFPLSSTMATINPKVKPYRETCSAVEQVLCFTK